MNKLDNYIYITICEVAMKEMKRTNYTSFINFCSGMAYSLSHESLYSREKSIMVEITNTLDKIYSMDEALTAKYIVDFFNIDSDIISKYQLCVLGTLEFFPLSFD
jgi:hypothetical protein